MLLVSNGTIALFCFGSSLLHECGHLFFLRLFSVDVRLISFSAGGILMERRSGAFSGFLPECLIALGGIAVNLLLCGCFALCYSITEQRTFGVLGVINGALAVMNLLPVRSLDGYRVLELLCARRMPERYEQLTTCVSLTVVCVITAICICLFCCGLRNSSLAAVCVYLMLLHWKSE